MQTATRYLDVPADFGATGTFRLETATLPAFSGLSENVNGAFAYDIDGKTRLNVFGGMVTTPDIQVLPLLQGTSEERLNDPTLRPAPCGGSCGMLKDVVYLANVNFIRNYSGLFPRADISGRPIPIDLSLGVTAKYYFEELEGGDYLAQNLNLDAGACVNLAWGYDPVSRVSRRDFKIQVAGFEILPTRQKSSVGGVETYESLSRRWRFSASWEEGFPAWNSTLNFGVSQKTESGQWPAAGAEWDYRGLLFLRGGWDRDFLSAGGSVAYRWMSIHYAFRHHELGNSLYQVSAQVQWP